MTHVMRCLQEVNDFCQNLILVMLSMIRAFSERDVTLMSVSREHVLSCLC